MRRNAIVPALVAFLAMACGGAAGSIDKGPDAVDVATPGDLPIGDVTDPGTSGPDLPAVDLPPDPASNDPGTPDDGADVPSDLAGDDGAAGDLDGGTDAPADAVPDPSGDVVDDPGVAADVAPGDDPGVADPGPADVVPEVPEEDASDASATDASVPGQPWPWCPTAAAYVGDAWAGQIDVAATARYCGMFDETRTMEQELARKVELTLVPGTYALPDSSGTTPFTLPFCLRFLVPDAQPVPSAPGTLAATVSGTSQSYSWTQPMTTAGGDAWVLQASFYTSGSGSPALALDGAYKGGAGLSPMICKGDCSQYIDFRRLASCVFEGTTLNRHTIVFRGGEAVLDLRLGVSMAGTEPGIFYHANGTLDGTAFTQDAYRELVYNPAHHHFTRNFAVLFDAPIGTACGLRVDGFDPYTLAATVHTIDCQLQPVEARELFSAKLDRL